MDPSLDLANQFVLNYLQGALAIDNYDGSPALEHEVNTPDDVSASFGNLPYDKGSSLLLMLRYLCTEKTFKKALQYYLVAR